MDDVDLTKPFKLTLTKETPYHPTVKAQTRNYIDPIVLEQFGLKEVVQDALPKDFDLGLNPDDGPKGFIEIGPIKLSFLDAQIPFATNKSEFKDDEKANSELDRVVEQSKDWSGPITVIPNANYPEYDTFTEEQKQMVNELIRERGEVIKGQLIDKGIDPDRIKVEPGDPDRTTTTNFIFE